MLFRKITAVYSENQKKSVNTLCGHIYIKRVFSAQADWILTHRSHKDTEQSTIEASITLDDVTLTGPKARNQDSELGLGAHKNTRGQPVKN
jgi:hypothetical protein